MQGTVLGDLTIDVALPIEDKLVLTWKGASNSRDPAAPLQVFFSLVFAEAATRKVGVEQHFEQLKFFNSSTVSALMRIVAEAGHLGVPMTLKYDGSLRWQAHNFEGIAALTKVIPGLRVQPVTAPPGSEQVGAG